MCAPRAPGACDAPIMLKRSCRMRCRRSLSRAPWRRIAILFEAGLSFLGLSDPNTISWGSMIGPSRRYLRDAWWAVTFPGLAIFLTVLSISLVGDGLNDAFNPRLRADESDARGQRSRRRIRYVRWASAGAATTFVFGAAE